MPSVRVKKTFIHNGETVEPGTILNVPNHALVALGEYAEQIPTTTITMMKQASDIVRFCLAHENTYPDGHCPVKNSKQDPFTNCVGWQLKQGKRVTH